MTLIEIVVKPLEVGKNDSDMLETLLKRISRWPKFKMIDKKVIRIGGEQAFSALYESETHLPMESLNAKPVRVVEQNIFLVRRDKSYRFAFHVLADQYKKYSPVFEHVLKTFQFAKGV